LVTLFLQDEHVSFSSVIRIEIDAVFINITQSFIYNLTRVKFMEIKMPQELEVWYVLPAIRRELAKVLISSYHLSQRDAASAIGITESAVSQYLKSKRGKGIVFDAKVIERINQSADNIVNNKSCVIKELQAICTFFKKTGYLCEMHKQANTNLPCDCEVCIK